MSEPTEIKLCKDCKFFTERFTDRLYSPFVRKYAQCTVEEGPDSKVYDYYIAGKGKRSEPDNMWFCSVMRKHKCGEDAKLFVPKNSGGTVI